MLQLTRPRASSAPACTSQRQGDGAAPGQSVRRGVTSVVGSERWSNIPFRCHDAPALRWVWHTREASRIRDLHCLDGRSVRRRPPRSSPMSPRSRLRTRRATQWLPRSHCMSRRLGRRRSDQPDPIVADRTASRHTHAQSAPCPNPHSTSTARSVCARTRASTSRIRSGNWTHAKTGSDVGRSNSGPPRAASGSVNAGPSAQRSRRRRAISLVVVQGCGR
jgi:hypothetical protein